MRWENEVISVCRREKTHLYWKNQRFRYRRFIPHSSPMIFCFAFALSMVCPFFRSFFLCVYYAAYFSRKSMKWEHRLETTWTWMKNREIWMVFSFYFAHLFSMCVCCAAFACHVYRLFFVWPGFWRFIFVLCHAFMSWHMNRHNTGHDNLFCSVCFLFVWHKIRTILEITKDIHTFEEPTLEWRRTVYNSYHAK